MTFLIISFIAGMLTVLAPCILPLLPVVVGSSASGRSRATPYVVVGALSLSIILFTYILKVSAIFITVPPEFWTSLSGGILIVFGLTLLFPDLWEKLPGLATLSARSNMLVGSGYQRKSLWGDMLIGAALGPVFSSCSPTYFVILASVLPVSFALGTLYLLAYVLGLSLMLLGIGLLGQHFADRLGALSDPHGRFKRILGVLFLFLGVLIVTGYEKKIETAILQGGFFDVTRIEQSLLRASENDSSAPGATSSEPYKEIVDPAGFVNTESIRLKDLVGQKVILIDFLTYSCINCQRTFPYLVAWDEKYNSEGLAIIGIHTPEFAFEKNIQNVRVAMQKFGIHYPVVLDNDFGTWRAYGNQYWPSKYLIDIHGNVVYRHFGEGDYVETEMKIRELLKERAEVLGGSFSTQEPLVSESIQSATYAARSPETYFGSRRNEYLGNGTPFESGGHVFVPPQSLQSNTLYMKGLWNMTPEYAEALGEGSVFYRYNAKEVYIVVDADEETNVDVYQDGVRVGQMTAGEDVNPEGYVRVKQSRLYKLIKNGTSGEHLLELRVRKGVRCYAFTFG